LFQVRESLVSDIPAGDGKIDNLFHSVAGPKLTSSWVKVQAVLYDDAVKESLLRFRRTRRVPFIAVAASMLQFV
jgi:hypothetical protein